MLDVFYDHEWPETSGVLLGGAPAVDLGHWDSSVCSYILHRSYLVADFLFGELDDACSGFSYVSYPSRTGHCYSAIPLQGILIPADEPSLYSRR